MSPELSCHSLKLNEILAQDIVRYALKNDMESNSVTQTITVTEKKFRKFQMATPSYLYWNVISTVKNPK